MPEWITQLDTSLFLFLNRDCQNSFFDLIMPFITSRPALIVAPFFLIFFLKERKRALVILAVSFFSILAADASTNVLKHFMERQRPCNVLENINLLVGCTRSFSMPSSHAANSFAFAVPFLALSKNRLKYVFLFIAVVVSLSRVFVGVHYPADIVAGGLTGSLAAMTALSLFRWAEKRFRDRPFSTFMYVFLLCLSLFRLYYLAYGPLDLSGDEAHYWEWSRRLDLSYYSKGPMIAYLIALSTSLFGSNAFGVRFFAVVLMAASSLILYRLGKEMYGERVGAASAVLLQLIPLYSTFGVVFTIDSPFVFFWILSLYLFWKAVRRDGMHAAGRTSEGGSYHAPLVTLRSSLWYWILAGTSVGLGLLTKYTMAFFFLGALCFLIASPPHRRLFRTAGPYAALLVSLVFFSPVIVWNARNDWVTVRHTAGQAHLADGLRISLQSFAEFLVSQLGVLTPVLCVLILAALWKVRNRPCGEGRPGGPSGRPDDSSSPSHGEGTGGGPEKAGSAAMPAGSCGRFLFWFAAPVIVFFAVKSIQGKVQPNWAMMGYLTGLIAFSEVFAARWERKGVFAKNVVVIGVLLSLAVTVVAHYPLKFCLPPRLDPSSRLRGWNELGRQVHAEYQRMREKGNVFIFSDGYQTASEVAFYVEGHPVTYCVNLGRRMNEYDLWPGFQDLIHSNGIFVTIGDGELDPRIREAFRSFEKRTIRVYDKSNRFLREYSIFMCYDFQGLQEETTGDY
ncbi:MAG: glycosyltransferase family 39 protein [Nitrospirae bacterium]|nr:glycosyltransferase family 39 protein [Nitrospirota bacterium]